MYRYLISSIHNSQSTYLINKFSYEVDFNKGVQFEQKY